MGNFLAQPNPNGNLQVKGFYCATEVWTHSITSERCSLAVVVLVTFYELHLEKSQQQSGQCEKSHDKPSFILLSSRLDRLLHVIPLLSFPIFPVSLHYSYQLKAIILWFNVKSVEYIFNNKLEVLVLCLSLFSIWYHFTQCFTTFQRKKQSYAIYTNHCTINFLK